MRPYVYAGGVAVLTGAASGIGQALAHGLAARGSHLALIDRDGPGLERVAAAIGARCPALRVTAHTCDLAHTGGIPGLADEVLRAHGRVTLLVNNAGVALGGTFEQVTPEQFGRVLAVNFGATVALCRALLPALRSSLGGQIVNLSSLYGIIGPPGQAAYSASKFAVRGFSEALRHELAPHGIGVTVVHPGGIRTNIARHAEAAPGVSPAEIEAGRRAQDRLLRLPPEQAAGIILRATERRAPRVLVGSDARAVDLLARLVPGDYWGVLGRLFRA